MEVLNVIKKFSLLTLTFSLINSCNCQPKNEERTLKASSVNPEQIYFEYFDYFNFVGVNELDSPKRFPFIGIEKNNQAIIVNIYLSENNIKQRIFHRRNEFYFCEETTHPSIYSGISERTLTVISPNKQFFEYHFIEDYSSTLKLLSIVFFAENYDEKHYDIERNINIKIQDVPFDIDDSIQNLEKEFETSFELYEFRYEHKDNMLFKILVDEVGDEKTVETYEIQNLSFFYKDYLHLIN